MILLYQHTFEAVVAWWDIELFSLQTFDSRYNGQFTSMTQSNHNTRIQILQ